MNEADLKEGDLQRLIMIELSARGHFVARGNVGLFYTKDGRPCRTGLPVGFADTFGHRDHDCKAFYLEVKTLESKRMSANQRAGVLDELREDGASAEDLSLAQEWMLLGARKDQAKFLLAMHRRGAIAGVVRSVKDAVFLLSE